MKKIGVFYGPSQGNVAKVANLISKEFGENNTELVLVKNASVEDIKRFDKIIFGLSTIGKANWDSYHKDTDWDVFMTFIGHADWSNKTVAIFGLGDQLAYPDNFVDGIGWLYEKLKKLNVNIVGSCSTDGYQFNESEGLVKDQFMGLPIDEDNESELTGGRVRSWIEQLKKSGF